MYTVTVFEREEEVLDAAEKHRPHGDTSPVISGGKIVINSVTDSATLEGDERYKWEGKPRAIITAALKRLGLEVEFK